MKRKGSDFKNNPMYGAKKSKTVYFGDPSLIPRIREYLADNKSKKNISIPVLASDLQRKYGEYARKKRNAFTKTVGKAYSVICEEEEQEKEEKVADEFSALEAKHLKQKQACTAHSSDTSDEESSFSSDNPDYVQYEDTNTMNNMMSTFYRKTPQKADSGTEGSANKHKLPNLSSLPDKSSPSRETVSVPPKQPSEIGSCDISFFIDRGGDRDILNKGNIASQYNPNTPPVEKRLGHKHPKRNNSAESRPHSSDQSYRKIDEDLELDVSDKLDKDKLKKVDKEQVSDKRLRKKSRRDGDKSSTKPEKKSVEAQKSSITFADFGGNEVGLKEVCKLLVHLRHPEVYSQLGVTPPRGFLLHGPPGCGKTLLAHAIAGELDLPFLKVAGPELVSGVSGESEEKIRELFEKAMASAPCIVFIDEIDAITPKRETASKDMERRIVAQLLSCMDDLSSNVSSHVLVIGATNRPDSLDPALRRAGRFDREISLGIPDESARLRILKVLCRNLRLEEEFDFMYLAKNTPGFVGADLMALAREAAMTAVNRVFNELKTNLVKKSGPVFDAVHMKILSEEQSPISIEKVSGNREPSERETKLRQEEFELDSVLTWLKDQPPLTDDQLKNLFILLEDFKEALKHVQPSAKREGFATIPDVTWDDVGALYNVREELQLAILAPVRHREEFESLGIQRAQGILLAGPPGCGKTLLAKAIANESGINFISVKGPELLNMYVGESERAVRQVFQRARNSAPCVIFFDELDALCPRRSNAGEGGSSVRVVNQLLTEMDGLEERKQVFIMAATNRPDIIDPAVLRPGRLDKTLYIGLPSAEDRLDILKTITKNGTKPQLDDVVLADIANDERCKGYTGADLAALVREASVLALKEVISPGSSVALKIGVHVRNQHFDTAFSRIKPSVSEKDQQKYLKMQH